MTIELKELKQHVRWLEDELSHGTAVDECLDAIDGRLDAIDGRLDAIADAINRNAEVLKTHAEVLNKHADVLKQLVEVLAAPRPQPSIADVFGAAFKPGEPKQPAANPKPRKAKLSVVPTKDGDEGPGAAP